LHSEYRHSVAIRRVHSQKNPLNWHSQNNQQELTVLTLSRSSSLLHHIFSVSTLAAALLTSPAMQAQTDAGADWPLYRGSLSGTGYSSLNQITPANVNSLREAWRISLRSNSAENTRSPNSQTTPIVINDLMYLPTVDRILAVNPLSGDQVWSHDVNEGRPSRRGVSYWPGNQDTAARIIFTAGSRLVALDANTGIPVAQFGNAGETDLGTPYLSVPLVYDNIIVVGANTPPGQPGGIGNPRAYDAVSGNQLWEFSSVPQPGQIGHDSWEGDSWQNRLGANAWPFYFTVDTERDLLYLPLASPIPFAYGGDRAGDNLFANSIVAVDLHTGDYRWHFQTIHHDLWDHDPPAPPTLFEINRDGAEIPALAVTTKSGYLFILNRATGEPIYEMQEQSVPQSNLPGEQTSPTQPIPTHIPPMARVSFAMAELATANQTSSEHAQACAQLLDDVGQISNLGPYTPWSYKPPGSSNPTTLLFPGLAGGPNWGGVAFDPNNNLAFVFAADIGSFGWMEDAEPGAEFPYVRNAPRPGNFAVNIDGTTMPCQQPPWSHLTAVDVTTGEMAWRVPLGVTESLPSGRQNTGRPGRAAGIITASGLMFIASTDDNRFRALQTQTGEIVWETELDQRGNANPMTFLGSDNKQYIAIAATNELIVFSLQD
jgi:quinoprotein glucose dehydrogenase